MAKPRKSPVVSKPDPVFLEQNYIDEQLGLILAGNGPLDARVLLLGEKPDAYDIKNSRSWSSRAYVGTLNRLKQLGVRTDACRKALAVRYAIPGGGKPGQRDVTACRKYLDGELETVKPELVVTFGGKAFSAVVGTKYKYSEYRGALSLCPDRTGIQLFATYSPGAVYVSPEIQADYHNELELLAGIIKGDKFGARYAEHQEYRSTADVLGFKADLDARTEPILLTLDCEWHGATWMSADRYIRIIQLSIDDKSGMVFAVRDPGGVVIHDDEPGFLAAMKSVLEHPMVRLAGHHVISDGLWLLSYGIDIRPNTVHDTILTEHLLNETGPFGLEQLSLRHTDYGRYDLELSQWKRGKKDLVAQGFGHVPREILNPYGATDTAVTMGALIAQRRHPEYEEFLQPRGRYPSLFETDHRMQKVVYEMELTGMPVDQERLQLLIRKYTERYKTLKAVVKTSVEALGVKEFNPKSTQDMQKLLFDVLKLNPISTTKGRPWKWVANQPESVQRLHTPTTDKDTLCMLQEAHPVVKSLLHLSILNTALKMFLRDDDDIDLAATGGGIKGNIWPDGRLHPRYSQLKKTRRMGSAGPNVQNFPKRTTKDVELAFGGKDKAPPGLRSVIVAPPGWVIVEYDYIQAELFVLGRLSGDTEMWGQLTTPGKDLHDHTAIDSYHYTMTTHGVVITEEDLVEAARLCGGNTKHPEFEKLIKSLVYWDTQGKSLTRLDFKDSVRVGAKSINFGIPYGRQEISMAIQVKAETGDTRSVEEIAAEIAVMMHAWKYQSYPQAWDYMMACGDEAVETGVLVAPLGGKRRFPKAKSKEIEAAQRRQAQNFRIQNTVADALYIGAILCHDLRNKRYGNNPPYLFMNQIHDAIQFLCKENCIEQLDADVMETLANVEIPMTDGQPLVLGMDREIYIRWGEK
jgi:uracil-DNA glycosylase family 4